MLKSVEAQELHVSVSSRVLAALRTVLDEGSEPERCAAACALGTLGGEGVADALIGALRDPDPDVRCQVAEALATLQPESAGEALIANLRDDPVGEIKPVYISTLARLRIAESYDLLCALSVGRAEHLGVAWEDDMSGWDDWLDVQLAAIDALGVIGPGDAAPAVEAILAALNDMDGQDIWTNACSALARLSPQGPLALAALAENASVLQRKRIAAAMRHATQEEAEPIGSRLLDDEDLTVRLAALESAAALDLDELCQAAVADRSAQVRAAVFSSLAELPAKQLLGGLKDPDLSVCIAACRAIARTGTPRTGFGLCARIERHLRTGRSDVLAALIAAAAVAEPEAAAELAGDAVNNPATPTEVRLACLCALGTRQPEGALRLLAEAATDTDRGVRLSAVAALGELAKGATPNAAGAAGILAQAVTGALLPAPPDWQPDEAKTISFVPKRGQHAAAEEGTARVHLDREGNVVPKGERARTPELPESDEPAFPSSTLEAILGANTAEPAGPDLRRAYVEDADLPYLARAASRVSRRRLSLDDIPPPHVDLPRIAASVCATVPRSDLVEPLAAAARSADLVLAHGALDALSELAGAGIDLAPAGEAVLHLCQEQACGVSSRAVRLLSGLEPAQGLALAVEALQSTEADVRKAAVKACRDLGRVPKGALAGLLQDADRGVRAEAACALADADGDQAIAALIEFGLAENAVQMHEAVQLLKRFGTQALDQLVRPATEPDATRRYFALQMIAALSTHQGELNPAAVLPR
ncbi:MAG: HEAT repeat domain-containing protein [Pseudomonadota bacterium]